MGNEAGIQVFLIPRSPRTFLSKYKFTLKRSQAMALQPRIHILNFHKLLLELVFGKKYFLRFGACAEEFQVRQWHYIYSDIRTVYCTVYLNSFSSTITYHYYPLLPTEKFFYWSLIKLAHSSKKKLWGLWAAGKFHGS